MSNVTHYWKRKLVNGPLSAEYSSETNEISVSVEHKLKTGDVIYTDHFKIDPSAIEPLHKLLTQVVADE